MTQGLEIVRPLQGDSTSRAWSCLRGRVQRLQNAGRPRIGIGLEPDQVQVARARRLAQRIGQRLRLLRGVVHLLHHRMEQHQRIARSRVQPQPGQGAIPRCVEHRRQSIVRLYQF